MIEKFNGIFYLIVFLVHFIGFAYYGFRCVFQTQSFLNQYGMDATGASIVRFFGSIFLGSTVMAIYVGFIRPNGLEATWGFFNLIFLQNLSAFIVGFYSTKINHFKNISVYFFSLVTIKWQFHHSKNIC